MVNFNQVVLVGRLTRDPESKTVGSGGKLAKFGFAVTNRKKNAQGGWEDDPMFIDCEVWNRGETGRLADLVAERCKKGNQVLIEGRLHLDQWEDKNGGGKRSKHKLVVDNVQLLDPRQNAGQPTGPDAESVGTGPTVAGNGEEVPF